MSRQNQDLNHLNKRAASKVAAVTPPPLPLQAEQQRAEISCETPAFKDLADCLAAAEDAGDASVCMARYKAIEETGNAELGWGWG